LSIKRITRLPTIRAGIVHGADRDAFVRWQELLVNERKVFAQRKAVA